MHEPQSGEKSPRHSWLRNLHFVLLSLESLSLWLKLDHNVARSNETALQRCFHQEEQHVPLK